ncbi:MAG: hypothetical protein Q7T28_14380 [Cypionkella sp.]|uniref:hypothetical protein n=1 Tax=Cypionkella sp. TaxID=2811411 RepID=UPI00272792A2|nr:hypothetical protein [Cypionkella sp.]MDO8328109.1 hypothetical protein [Cypionkella sp.]
MVYRFWAAMAVVGILASCGSGAPFGNPVDPVDPTDPTPPVDPLAVPTDIAKNLRSITYDPSGGGKLKVDLFGLTASSRTATFVRAAALDVDGYRAFTYQETGLQRTHLAFVADGLRSTVRAATVADGGQFNQHYGGGTYSRIDVYQAPVPRDGVETGQFSYAGTYAGVFVPGDVNNAGLPAGLTPYTPYRVQGETLIDANFANNLVNGGVDNRWLLDAAGNPIDFNQDGIVDDNDKLKAIVFRGEYNTPNIDENGMFLGDVEFSLPDGEVPEGHSPIGTYGGMFGGVGATDIAGAIVLNPIPGNRNIWEYGVFNLPRCDLAGASPLCVPR